MPKEIQQRASFNIIRYANCWEDTEILIKALDIKQETRCLSIASAGDNSFGLLSQNPELIVAVDLNPTQLACVELRKIAFAELEYEDVLAFLGFIKSDERLNNYNRIKKYLSNNVAEFFDENPNLIANGLIHQGKFENYFRMFRNHILPLVHNQKCIKELLLEKTEDQKVQFFNKKWNTLRWRLLFRLFFNRFMMGRLGRDKEFFKYVDSYIISDNIARRVKHALTVLETHNNPYLTYILTGEYEQALPFYIRKENFHKTRENLDKLQLFNGTVTDAIKHYGGGFNAFNLSDIFEYMDDKLFLKVVNDILQESEKGSRLAYWNMMAHRKISDKLPQKVNYLQELSENLFYQDKAFFYKSFYVEEVR